FVTRFLHNQTAFLAQKKLVFAGLPMIVMPVRIL
ncbi:MAG: Amino acid transporter, partial [Actinobacteria bacterium]|nr:Amino acid transporter [Actinomycetota bacterium]